MLSQQTKGQRSQDPELPEITAVLNEDRKESVCVHKIHPIVVYCVNNTVFGSQSAFFRLRFLEN